MAGLIPTSARAHGIYRDCDSLFLSLRRGAEKTSRFTYIPLRDESMRGQTGCFFYSQYYLSRGEILAVFSSTADSIKSFESELYAPVFRVESELWRWEGARLKEGSTQTSSHVFI